MRSEEAS